MIQISNLETYYPRKVENQKDSDGRMIITPPRLNGLWIKQQSFRQCMEQFKWNYLLEGEEDYTEDDDYNDDDDKVNGIDIAISPTTNNTKRNYNDDCPLSVLSGDHDMANSDMVKSYPHLLKTLGLEDGFDPTDPHVQKSMCGLLAELNDILSTTYELNVSGISNKKISYVREPWTNSDNSFRNSKEWVNTAIKISPT
jgi:hypothetical protein